jgi:hypothetical protein
MANRAIRLSNGNLLVSGELQGPATPGEACVEIGPEHPDYARWLAIADPGESPPDFKDRRTWIPREDDLTPEGWRS